MLPYTVLHAGDAAIVIEFGDTIDPNLNRSVLRLSMDIEELAIAGVVETIPTFRSLMVQYDPFVVTADELIHAIKRHLIDKSGDSPAAKTWRLPVCYDSRLAEDLEPVAERLGISSNDLIEMHSSKVYSVYMLGFLPGQPYLGDLAIDLQIPRRTNPRMKVPAGSIGIATSLTCIFPMETPCGWHVIGRTPIKLWNQHTDDRPLFAPGDQVKFVPISLQEYETLAASVSKGLPTRSFELDEAHV